ncbi:MAG: DNA polymerase III subunit gamma and tau, partial [Dermatophilaceae bacterium]
VYIIDEAHMVTPQGFNALLKIVEEPPEHVKFVFATTEPEKVIGTIRSRTHHYPFRLVPPARLQAYLDELCTQEGVAVAPGVLSFVVRAGGGSVRDSLSVLDQLIAGSGDTGLTYESAAALLGFTDGELLDATVDALTAGDAAAAFRAVDRVVETGLDPRRFVEDLLERLRDLIIVQAVGDGAAAVLRHHPEDQLARMGHQAAAFGSGALSRAADIANTGLTEMTGATAPRLHLELIIARVLLPGAGGEQGYAARLDRLERRLDVGGVPSASARSTQGQVDAVVAGPPSSGVPSPADRGLPADPGLLADPGRPVEPDDASGSSSAEPLHLATAEMDDAEPDGRAGPGDPLPRGVADAARASAGSSSAAAAPGRPDAEPGRPDAEPGRLDTDAVRRSWPDVIARLGELRRTTWTLVSQNAQVADYDGERVALTVATAGLAEAFRRGSHADYVRQALVDVLGLEARVEARPDDAVALSAAPAPSGDSSSRTSPAAGTSQTAGIQPTTPAVAGPRPAGAPPAGGPPAGAPPSVALGGSDRPGRSSTSAGSPSPTTGPPPGTGRETDAASTGSRSAQSSPLERARAAVAAESVVVPAVIDDSAISPDDEAVDGAGDTGVPVVQRILGGTVVAEDPR